MARCFKLKLELEHKIFEVEVELELMMRTVLIKKKMYLCFNLLKCYRVLRSNAYSNKHVRTRR